MDAYLDAPLQVPSLDAKVRAGQLAQKKAQIDHLPHLDQVYEFVQQHYVLETTIDNYAVYRLKRP